MSNGLLLWHAKGACLPTKVTIFFCRYPKSFQKFGFYFYLCIVNNSDTDMKTTGEYLQLLRDYKATKAAQYGISRIGIFGSVARGDHTEDSDVDICVDLKTPSLFYMVHIKEELQQIFGNPVDVIRIRPEMDALLKRDILREGIYA